MKNPENNEKMPISEAEEVKCELNEENVEPAETDTESESEVTENESSEPEKAPEDSTRFILTLTLKLLIISAVTAVMLAGVNALTADRIAANAAAEKAAAISVIFADSDSSEPCLITSEVVDELFLVKSGDATIGYTASVSPLGFGGKFSLMVGVNADGTVAGIKIISHSETPGLGSRVGEDAFLSQFTGLSGAVTIGNDVDAITGSTVSSKAITEGVNMALSVYDLIFHETGGTNE